MTTERDDLLAAVLTARESLAPDLDVVLLEEVLAAENANPDAADAAVRAIDAAVTRALERGAHAAPAPAADEAPPADGDDLGDAGDAGDAEEPEPERAIASPDEPAGAPAEGAAG